MIQFILVLAMPPRRVYNGQSGRPSSSRSSSSSEQSSFSLPPGPPASRPPTNIDVFGIRILEIPVPPNRPPPPLWDRTWSPPDHIPRDKHDNYGLRDTT